MGSEHDTATKTMHLPKMTEIDAVIGNENEAVIGAKTRRRR